jgi:hypothetical protein
MARQLARICPRCNGYLGVVVDKPKAQSMSQSITGSCLVCSHKLRWSLFSGLRVPVDYSGRIPKIFSARQRDSKDEMREN